MYKVVSLGAPEALRVRHRLFSICPYFAMFPEAFVVKYLDAFTKKNDYVFDPFCGRGTTILQSLLMDRNGAGTDTNPVAYCVSSAKANTPPSDVVTGRIDELERGLVLTDGKVLLEEKNALPQFFRYAYRPETLTSLLFLRTALKWRDNEID